MPNVIHDDLTDRTDLSRQEKYQIRRERSGKCRICGGLGAPLCKTHKAEARRRSRFRYALKTLI